MGKIQDKLTALGITLPEPAAPVANYVGYVVTGKLVFISGQVTLKDGKFEYIGKVGKDFSVEEGAQAARLCAINILAQLKAAVGGDLERVQRCVKLGGFVNAVPEFTDHPKVINGASDLIVEVLGDKGKHARFALGAGSLPLNVACEIDAVFEIA
ncbi:enamine deaminase RidA (YjgF/YER057c/UK114 family) [Rhodoligotrophos appendicifer]|uniref:RidA family protein n=1 Tax=Rhodoligotrophos appendicifer TaxID=987056 RepID=UPI001960BE9B|nr:RidA family protein [Rhodoligotrophos appendicifer]